jgi:hypothetical protein
MLCLIGQMHSAVFDFARVSSFLGHLSLCLCHASRMHINTQIHYPPPRDELLNMNSQQLRRYEALLSRQIAETQVLPPSLVLVV